MKDELVTVENGEGITLSIVIVLYRCSVSASSTCRSLAAQGRKMPARISCLIYDNSPAPSSESIPEGWSYVSDVMNGGLARAYNYASSLARQQDCSWLLLLDQDSVLPLDFLDGLLASIALVQHSLEIAAIVPRVFCGKRLISPVRPHLGRETPFNESGVISSGWISAINSATAIRLSFLENIGGFSNEFWLDYLDYWFFRILYESGKRVLVSDACVQHALSVVGLGRELDNDRFRNILAAEMSFTNRYLGPMWRVALAIRLFLRGTKHWIRGADRKLAETALKFTLSQLRYVSRLSRAK